MNTVTAYNPQTKHITDILERPLIANKEIFGISLLAIRILARELQMLNNPLKAGLVIPLQSDFKQIINKVPNSFEDILIEMEKHDPPSLILESWEIARNFTITEEFRTPLKFPLFDEPLQKFYFYYREFRYERDYINDWEYSRCIFVEYYPDGHFSN